MVEKTQKQMIQEVHQGMFGVEGSDDKGLVGDVKETKEDIRKQNGRLRKAETGIKQLYGMVVGAALAGGGIGAGISKLVG